VYRLSVDTQKRQIWGCDCTTLYESVRITAFLLVSFHRGIWLTYKRMSGTATFFLWIISFYWAIKAVHFFLDMRRLWDIHNFYTYLLEIPDQDMQTVSWQEVVARLMILRDDNPTTSETVRRRHYTNQSKQRMDAHDIANRLMRKENYLIALFNKEILDLTIPIPFLRSRGSMLTKTLEWNLSLTILDYVFNEQGQLNSMFLKEGHRRILSDA
jgi:autophagy-related protein 9